MSAVTETLKGVPFLGCLDDGSRERLAARSRRIRSLPGQCLVSELEPGADVYVILQGEAEVSVDARGGERRVLQKLGPGSGFGEMSSLTGELRSATVSAIGEVEALVIADAEFDRLREERPQVALALARELAKRLGTVEATLEDLLTNERPKIVTEVAQAAHATPDKGRRGSIGRAWRELVVGRKQDCAFLTLAAFVMTLLLVRLIVHVAFQLEATPRDLMRTLYVSGFALVAGSACTSLLTFRPSWRRWIAVAYGIGTALILNELGVTLAFDIFYKDIHTADPNVTFDLERLYRRAEPLRAIAIGLVVLVQAAYLRRFYRRAAFVLMTRLRRLRR
jgi:CRP-like cAMP-binding protein